MLQKFLSNRSAFAKNIIALVSATALAQVINFGFNILLTRLYIPDDFGVLSLFQYLGSFIIVLSAGKYDVALVAAKEREDARGLTSLGLNITIAVALLTLIAAWLIYSIPVNFYANNPVHKWFYLIPLSVIFLSTFQVLWMWNVREKRFKNISFIRPLEAFINNGFCIFLKAYKELGLILGSLAGQLISVTIIAIISLKKDGMGLFFTPFKKLGDLSMKYSEFPRVNILQGFADVLQISLLVLVASTYFSPAQIGFYALCMRVLQAPARLITLPLAHVFFSEASESYREGKDMHALVKRVTYQTGKWLIAMPIILIIAGPLLFKIIFGDVWREAGVYAAILSPWIFLDMIRGPIVQVASIVGKQKTILIITGVSSGLLLLCVVVGVYYKISFRYMLGVVSALQTIMCFYTISLIFRMSKTTSSSTLK